MDLLRRSEFHRNLIETVSDLWLYRMMDEEWVEYLGGSGSIRSSSGSTCASSSSRVGVDVKNGTDAAEADSEKSLECRSQGSLDSGSQDGPRATENLDSGIKYKSQYTLHGALSYLFAECPRLRHLSLTMPDENGMFLKLPWQQVMPRLWTLELALGVITEEMIMQVFLGCDQGLPLKELRCTRCWMADAVLLSVLLPRCPYLEVLRLELDEELHRWLRPGHRLLGQGDEEGPHGITEIGLEAVLHQLPSLRELHVYPLHVPPASVLPAILKKRTLRAWTLSLSHQSGTFPCFRCISLKCAQVSHGMP